MQEVATDQQLSTAILEQPLKSMAEGWLLVTAAMEEKHKRVVFKTKAKTGTSNDKL